MKKTWFIAAIFLIASAALGGSIALYGVRATSVLAPQGGNNYRAENAADGKLSTAWVEGKSGQGIGEKVLFEVGWDAYKINAIRVYPGYGKSKSAFYDNSRVKRAQLTLYMNECCNEICPEDNDGPECDCNEFLIPKYQAWTKEVTFRDEMEFQSVAVPDYKTCEGAPCCTWLEIKILDVYPGAKWSDTAISEVELRYQGR